MRLRLQPIEKRRRSRAGPTSYLIVRSGVDIGEGGKRCASVYSLRLSVRHFSPFLLRNFCVSSSVSFSSKFLLIVSSSLLPIPYTPTAAVPTRHLVVAVPCVYHACAERDVVRWSQSSAALFRFSVQTGMREGPSTSGYASIVSSRCVTETALGDTWIVFNYRWSINGHISPALLAAVVFLHPSSVHRFVSALLSCAVREPLPCFPKTTLLSCLHHRCMPDATTFGETRVCGSPQRAQRASLARIHLLLRVER